RGLALVQYQQQQYFNGGFAPFALTVGGPALPRPGDSTHAGSNGSAPTPPPVTVAHDRVTDETAPVRVVADGHPAVLRPNPLEEGDWRGWGREGGVRPRGGRGQG